MMDAAVAAEGGSKGAITTRIEHAMAPILAAGGVLVLDWHVEQWQALRLGGAAPALLSVLARLASQGDAWWASPTEVATWWNARDARLWSEASR